MQWEDTYSSEKGGDKTCARAALCTSLYQISHTRLQESKGYESIVMMVFFVRELEATFAGDSPQVDLALFKVGVPFVHL
jgi:hypothetical protein